jgi:hypothetical protein
MISGRRARMQLGLDLWERPAPAAALWELLDEERRRAAMTLLSALIAQAATSPMREPGGEAAPLRGGGAPGGRDG